MVGWLSGVARLLWATARCRATGQPDRELESAEQFILQSFPPVRKEKQVFKKNFPELVICKLERKIFRLTNFKFAAVKKIKINKVL